MIGSIVLSLCIAQSATQKLPSEYAKALNWNETTQGPLLYMPNRRLQTPDSPALEGGFKTFECGSLHVIGPAQMTVIDPNYDQPANLYDGLPRNLKVLYLASTFTDSQWRTACSDGIGLSDMTKDQQAVYRSTLPSQFVYETTSVYNLSSNQDPKETKTVLTTDEESQVRLKIFKQLTLGIRLQDGGFSAMPAQNWDRYKPGTRISHRSEDTAEDKNSAFGVEIRKTLPNQPKPSDLNVRSAPFDAPLELSAHSTVKQICQEASQATGLTILADARFADEPVAAKGSSARTGDVLMGLARCLTGTYRKVGSTYVLTSDLEGIGTKMTKLALWHWNLTQASRWRAEEWKKQIAGNPGIAAIAYAADDVFKPNEAMQHFMDTDFGQAHGLLPAGSLTPECVKLLNANERFPSPVRTDVAEPWDSVFWCFVAPGNQTLQWESELCGLNDLTHNAESQLNRDRGQNANKLDVSALPGSALVYQTKDREAATKLPELAKNHGFTEIWLQTTDADVLAAAIAAGKAAGIQIRLVVEPFTATGEEQKGPLDRSILGRTYSEGETLVNASEQIRGANTRITASERSIDYLPQDAPTLAAYWKQLDALAATTGLTGTVVLSPSPVGYERQSDWAMYESAQQGAALAMGYSLDLREKFLLANSVDPVDLTEVRYQSELRPLEQSISSFGDLNEYLYGATGGPGGPTGYRDRWDKLRFGLNEARLKTFESGISQPMIVEWRRALHDTSLRWDGVVSAAPAGSPSEILTEDPYLATLPADAFYLQRIGYPMSERASAFWRLHTTLRLKRQSTRLAIDCRAVPPDQLQAVLASLISP